MAKTYSCGCGPRGDPHLILDREGYPSERFMQPDILLTCAKCRRPILESEEPKA